MFKYKNVTETVLKFRANDLKGIKKVYELKPGKEQEFGSEAKFGGLQRVTESVGKGKKTKKIGDE